MKASKVYLHTLLYEMVQGEPTDLRAKWIPYSRMMCDRFRRAVSNWEVANLDVLLNGLKTLGLNGALRAALPDDESRRQVSSAAVEVIQTRKDIVASRHKERAVDFIGCWLTGEADLPQWKNVMEEIMKSAEVRISVGRRFSRETILLSFRVRLTSACNRLSAQCWSLIASHQLASVHMSELRNDIPNRPANFDDVYWNSLRLLARERKKLENA